MTRLTVDGVAEDDGLVDLQLGEEGVEAVYFLALGHEGVELRDTLLRSHFLKRTRVAVRKAQVRAQDVYSDDNVDRKLV